MPIDETPLPRRPVAVVRAGGDAAEVGWRLAGSRPGSDVDLSRGAAPVLPSDIRRVADEVAARRADADARAHKQRAAQLRTAADAAAEASNVAQAVVDQRRAEQRRLLRGAAWCDEQRALVGPLQLDIDAAATAEADAQARLAVADARLAAVTEQRAAAEGVLGEARRQLAEMEVTGQGENEVRRALEQTMQAARTAEAAEADLRADADRCAAAVAAAEVRLRAAEDAMVALRAVAAGDPDAVGAALARIEAALGLEPSPADRALADQLERLEAAAAAGPVVADVGAAHRAWRDAVLAAEAAKAAIDQLRHPGEHPVPEWWDDLATKHTEVVEAQAGVSGNFPRRSGRRRLEAAVAAERALLDELGYPSHLDALLSGGRPYGQPRDAGAVAATQALAHAESERAAAEELVARAEELQRLRAEAGARLGRPPAGVTPDDLRRRRPDPSLAADLAAAMGVANDPCCDLAELARAWLTRHRDADTDLAATEAVRRNEAEALTDGHAALEAARTAVAAAAATTAAARRRALVLEGELGNRVEAAVDPVTRAASAAALRDRIGALEARIVTAESGAAEERAAAAAALSRSTAALAAAHRAVTDLTNALAALAPLAGDPPPRTGELAADIDATALALRATTEPVGAAAELAVRLAAAAAAEAAAGRAALEHHRATPPGTVSSAVVAEAVALLLDPEHRTSDVLVEPLAAAGDDASARAAVLDAVVAAGHQRSVFVLTDDPVLLGWAIDLPPEVGGFVPLTALQFGSVRAEELAGTPPDPTTDRAPATARPAH